MNSTLFSYILKKQFKTIVFVSVSVFFLVLLFDFAEVSRKFSITDGSSLLFDIKLSFLRTPITFCEILNYMYFITATFSLWDLCRSHQITILKSIGKSPMQILFPFVGFSFCVALVWLFIFHPLGIISENLYKRAVEQNEFSSFEKNNDIWIDYGENNRIIFIKAINQNKMLNFYMFNSKDHENLFAQSGEIHENLLVLKNVSILKGGKAENKDLLTISDKISSELIDLLSLPPHRQSIYSLYKVYKIQNENGVSLRLYELALHRLLVGCVSFVLFALIAAIICFPINRYKSRTNIAIKVIFSALILKFLSELTESLTYTGVISVILSAWCVTLIALLTAISILIWKEA